MIVIVDYGMGNLRSVSKALEHLGGKVQVSSSSKDISKADKLILPGVGAFGDACKELKRLALFDPIKEFIAAKKPFLGVCLGLQLLFESSEESPGETGLGVFKGAVQLFRSKNVKIPHMGWNDTRIVKEHALLKNVPSGSFFYFVHSYYAKPVDPALILAATQYGEEEFPAILGTATALATQFHPEKSQEAGLAILKNFVNW